MHFFFYYFALHFCLRWLINPITIVKTVDEDFASSFILSRSLHTLIVTVFFSFSFSLFLSLFCKVNSSCIKFNLFVNTGEKENISQLYTECEWKRRAHKKKIRFVGMEEGDGWEAKQIKKHQQQIEKFSYVFFFHLVVFVVLYLYRPCFSTAKRIVQRIEI